jgi:hypothetical protein
MASVNAGIQDVAASTGAGAGIIHIVGVASGAVGDAAQTPRSTRLGGVGVKGDNGILLDVVNLEKVSVGAAIGWARRRAYIGVVTESLQGLLVELSSETLEEGAVDSIGGSGEDAGDGIVDGGEGGLVLELDNVLVGNKVIALGGQERGGLGTLGLGSSQDHGQDSEEDVETHDG